MSTRPVRVSLISLGCPKNLVDSENVLGLLGERGYVLTPDPAAADLVILNTCGFLQSAVREAETQLARLARLKRRNPRLRILLYGCLVQRDPAAAAAYPFVDGIVGTGDPGRVIEAAERIGAGERPELVARGTFTGQHRYPRLVSTFPYAYLKIAEGCDNRCSYCLIPSLRGPLRSRPMKDVVAEAEEVAGLGARELILVAQDTTAYGRDLPGKANLAVLLKRLVRVGVPRIRILYAYPTRIDDALLEVLAAERAVCRYLDIPLQHLDPEILKRMNRPADDYAAIIARIRAAVPGIILRTTLMVGFPGERAAHFQRLLAGVRELALDNVGFFAYSPEEGSPAFGFAGRVPARTRQARLEQLALAQRAVSRRRLAALLGRTVEVLVDRVAGKTAIARTEGQAPEIDGVVRFTAGHAHPGDFIRVRITGCSNHDLTGESHG